MTDRWSQVANELPDLSPLVDYHLLVADGRAEGLRHPYYAGLQKARAGEWEEAELLLEKAWSDASVKGCGLEPAACQALAEVYRGLAERKLSGGDLAAAAGYLTQARELDPSNARVAALLDTLGFALPVLHVASGKRELAREVWEKALAQDGNDTRTAHALALLHYYAAREHLDAGRLEQALASWERSAEYWSLVLHSPRFLTQWIKAKTPVYGKTIDPEDVQHACGYATSEILRTVSQAAGELRAAGHEPSYRAAMRSYGKMLGELRAAELLADALHHLGAKAPKGARVGGPGALARLGGLKAAQEAIGAAARAGLAGEVAARLEIAYSGEAPEWGLVEAKLFDVVVAELGPQRTRSARQNELLARAYVELGILAKDESGSRKSFRLWAQALEVMPQGSPLRTDIEKHAIAVARVIVGDPRKHGLQGLRAVVDDMRTLAKGIETERFKTNLSVALRQLAGAEFRENGKGKAKGLLEEALRYNRDNQAARRELSAVVCSEGVDIVNAAISAFNPACSSRDTLRREFRQACEKFNSALDLDPGNRHAKGQYAELLKIMLQLGGLESEVVRAMGKLK